MPKCEVVFARALRLDNPAGLDAACTDFYPFSLTILNSPDLLEVGVPAFFGLIVGMADIIANHGFFSADFTHLCHYRVSF